MNQENSYDDIIDEDEIDDDDNELDLDENQNQNEDSFQEEENSQEEPYEDASSYDENQQIILSPSEEPTSSSQVEQEKDESLSDQQSEHQSEQLKEEDMKEIQKLMEFHHSIKKKMSDKQQDKQSRQPWRNRWRSKIEILEQIKLVQLLGTDQTISILPSSLNEQEQIDLSMHKAQRYNQKLVEERKYWKNQFQNDFNNQVQSRQPLTGDSNFPGSHIPFMLRKDQQQIILPPQNLFVRRVALEQFIKINLDNENEMKALKKRSLQKKRY